MTVPMDRKEPADMTVEPVGRKELADMTVEPVGRKALLRRRTESRTFDYFLRVC